MNRVNTNNVLQKFIDGHYPQIHCEKCEMTFLTNVYDFSNDHVLLEKRSLGLEYYCGAIHNQALVKIPDIHRVGVIDEDHQIAIAPSKEQIYSGEETDLRFIYLMEKLRHLEDEDAAYFDRCVKDLDWRDDVDRNKIIAGITKRYNAELAQDVLKLYQYYKQYEDVLAWDLHGDNLMHRLDNDEIVVLDPYTRRA